MTSNAVGHRFAYEHRWHRQHPDRTTPPPSIPAPPGQDSISNDPRGRVANQTRVRPTTGTRHKNEKTPELNVDTFLQPLLRCASGSTFRRPSGVARPSRCPPPRPNSRFAVSRSRLRSRTTPPRQAGAGTAIGDLDRAARLPTHAYELSISARTRIGGHVLSGGPRPTFRVDSTGVEPRVRGSTAGDHPQEHRTQE